MKDRIAICNGLRTPFCKAMGKFKDINCDDLAVTVIRELIAQCELKASLIDSVIIGNVLQTPQLANVARIIAIKSGLENKVSAYTVNRNCASGIQAITDTAHLLQTDRATVAIAGGTESMSNTPILLKREMRDFLWTLSRSKGFTAKLSALIRFRLSMLFPKTSDISDPLCGLNMGQTAEILARKYLITRQEQDSYAFLSQQRAYNAQKNDFFSGEITPVVLPKDYKNFQLIDDGIRENQTIESLESLKPIFNKLAGTVTAGTSSQITDGAAALLMMKESKAKELGYLPIGYIRDFEYAGVSPELMGIGPCFSTAKLLDRQKMTLEDFDLIEINEAFAAQVLACVKIFESPQYAKEYFSRDLPLGKIPIDKLNVNGGAIALGHPFGASGIRLVLTLLRELKRRNKNSGLAMMCVGGGQGATIALEVS